MLKDMQGSSDQDFARFLSAVRAYAPTPTPTRGLFSQRRARHHAEQHETLDEFMQVIASTLRLDPQRPRDSQMSFFALTAQDHRIIGVYGDIAQKIGYNEDEPLVGTAMSSLCTWPLEEGSGSEGLPTSQNPEKLCFHSDVPMLHRNGSTEFFDVIRIPMGFLGLPIDLLIMKEIEHRTVEREKLHERVKELKCLYTVSEATRYSNDPIETVLQRVVEGIPPGFQYPVSTWCCITWEGKRYVSDDAAQETSWQLKQHIQVLNTQKTGSIHV